MIHLGTSGFSYKDWRGVFYPDGMAESDMLAYYAARFATVELNFTYYQMPGVRTIEGLCRKTPDGFTFCVKAHSSMTHKVADDEAQIERDFDTFRAAMRPMADQGKLGCVLCQFPWGFKRTAKNEAYVQKLPELLPDWPIVVEYRNIEWVSQATFEALKSAGLGFCCVDEPRLRGLFPPLAVYTSQIAYVRFHGRNAKSWWNHTDASERYNYLYTQDELSEWVPKIHDLAQSTEHVFVFFNNCHAGQAATNAQMMESLLGLI